MSTFVNVGDQWLVNVDKLNSNDGFIMYSYHLIFLIHFLYNHRSELAQWHSP